MKFWKLTSVITALVLSTSTNAALIERLDGLAYYDTDANLTWLSDANAAGTTMTWENANAWAASLEVAGVTGWRLPSASDCIGSNCADSEMGNLFYNELGGSANNSISDVHDPLTFNLFANVQPVSIGYWSETLYDHPSTPSAYYFRFSSGGTTAAALFAEKHVWAVQTGDVSAVPVPAAVWLFGSGLIGLVGMARRKKA